MLSILRMVLIALLCLMLGGLLPSAPSAPTEPSTSDLEGELLAEVSSLEEAEEIAVQYSIQLVHWEGGLALYTTPRDPADVIAEGIANGWPPLYPNYTDYELFNSQTSP